MSDDFQERGQQDRDIFDALCELPLFDSLFLKMQAQNINMVDGYLRDLEQDLLREYMETERTPVPTALFLGALSQMWVFASYELLRTWKQLVTELIDYNTVIEEIRDEPEFDDLKVERGGPKRAKFKRPKISEDLEDAFYNRYFREIEADATFAIRLVKARNLVQQVYRKITDIRVSLAKHEVPGANRVRAYAPGYARIDMVTGSLYWMIDRKDGSSAIISRRDLADEVAALRLSEAS